MPTIRIKIGASVDRDMAVAFRPLIESAKRARAQVDTELSAISKDVATKTRRGTDSAEGSFKKLSSAVKKETGVAEKAYQQMVAEMEGKGSKMLDGGTRAVIAFGKETSKNFGATRREFANLARDAEREMTKVERALKRYQATGGRNYRDQNGQLRTHDGKHIQEGSWVSRNGPGTDDVRAAGKTALSVGMKGAGYAAGIIGDVARGAGVNFDLASHVKSSTELEKNAVDLTNAAYMPGKSGAAGVRQDPRALMQEMQQVGTATGFDPNKAMEGLQKFVAKTGDLKTGRDIIQDMARYSRATGAEMDDMTDAAGDVANALGETDNKAEKVKSVMRAIAAGGKEGAVEIKDFAKQMAKVGAAAGRFEGDPTKVMAQMSAITQQSRARGGSASATQAATSTAAFANTFSKGKRLDAFKNFGVDVQGADGKVRDPKAIIMDAIKAASSKEKGGLNAMNRNMGSMFADVRARSATLGFEAVYAEKGGGEAGLKAVSDKFDELANATMNETEVAESFARSMATTEAKTQVFNNQLTAVANDLRTTLTPALLQLAPAMIAGAKGVANLASYIAKITGIDTPARTQNEAKTVGESGNARRDLEGHLAKGGKVTGDEVRGVQMKANDLQLAIIEKKRAIAALEQQDKGTATEAFKHGFLPAAIPAAVETAFGRNDDRKTQINAEKQGLETLMAESQKANSLVASLLGGTLKVQVVSLPAGSSPPSVDGAGRQPGPGK